MKTKKRGMLLPRFTGQRSFKKSGAVFLYLLSASSPMAHAASWDRMGSSFLVASVISYSTRTGISRWMWLAITLSFAFYLPVVLWADVSPIIGMLMLPKTCMYMWAVIMGARIAKNA